MKKYISMILVMLMLFTCVCTDPPKVYASAKSGESRAIAIVFDNSGSMYDEGDQAWCRATYAMEVFASMLNEGDTLLIYPMHPIMVGGQEYTMESPYKVTSAVQASTIREIFTEDAAGTPIESIDCAVSGLQAMQADKKYMIVLTDGGTFSKNGSGLTKERTRSELDKRIEEQAGNGMSVMYLGIGDSACMPTIEDSEVFVKRQAVNSEDVLSTLTEMCNQIFGRDILPKSRLTGTTMEFDISMSKLIVFVQGEDISGVNVTGSSGAQVGQQISSQQTKYATAGSGDYDSVPDTSLQGMMVTYSDCAAGSYTITYGGTATSVEVYYEPDADLDFVFTDAAGNTVNPNALYEGEYKVSFGMKDAKTNQLIASDLLGNPHYEGCYYVNGEDIAITYDGYSGETPVTLHMGDTFDAKLTATYLSGYTITKDTSDFGWPDGGIEVAARPAGELRLEISGGESLYSLQDLTEGTPFTAKVYYEGAPVTGEELEKVDLRWDPDTSNAEITEEHANDHYNLHLGYKDTSAPQDTTCGECTVTIYAFYAPEGCSETMTECLLTYNINDDFSPIKMELEAPDDYIVIDEIADSRPIVVRFTLNGEKMEPEDLAAIDLAVDCSGINYEVKASEQDSSYLIKLLPTEGIEEYNYRIRVDATYKDHIGRETQVGDEIKVTLSNTPLWVIWTAVAILLIVLFLIIWFILHIKVLPKYAHTTKKLSTLIYDGENVSQSTNFAVDIKKKQLKAQSKYGGKNFGVAMAVKAGKESYLYKPQNRRSAEVAVLSVKKFGPAKIQEAMIGSAKYVLDEEKGKLVPAIPNQKEFTLTNGMMIKYSGTIQDAGMDKDFEVTSKLNFRKK